MILAGDIGGTKTQLALSDDAGAPPRFERRYASGAYPALEPILASFLADARAALGETGPVQAACFGVAGPIQGDRVHLKMQTVVLLLGKNMILVFVKGSVLIIGEQFVEFRSRIFDKLLMNGQVFYVGGG